MDFLNIDTPPTQFNNVSYGRFSVEGHSEVELDSSISISNNSQLEATFTILPHNQAFGKFEILAPPRITKIFIPIMDTYVQDGMTTMNFNGGDLAIGNENNIIYRSFLRFDITTLPTRLLFTKALLKLKALEISGNATLNIYKVNNFWSEKTLTWASQPIKGELVKSFEVNNINTNIDVKDLVQDWYKDSNNNYGILLELEDESKQQKIRFGSKEIQGYEPRLEIEYFDPVIPQLKNAILNSYLNIPEHLNEELEANITIHSYKEENVLSSNIHIHLPDTLESSIEIQKGTLESQIIISGNDSLVCEFNIANNKVADLLSDVNISKQNLNSNVIIPSTDDLISEISIADTINSQLISYISIDNSTNGTKSLYGSLNVNRNILKSDITIATFDSLLSNITIKGESIKDLPSTIDITRNELLSNIHIQLSKDLLVNTTIATNDFLNANLFIPYKNNSELQSNIFIMQNSYLFASMFIRSPYLRSKITIKRNDNNELYSNIIIRDDMPYLISEINISAPWSNDLIASLTINNGENKTNQVYAFIF